MRRQALWQLAGRTILCFAFAFELPAQRVRTHPSQAALQIRVDGVVSRAGRSELRVSPLTRMANRLRTAKLVRKVGTEDGDPEEVIGAINGAVLDDLGRLLVLDRSFHAVRVFQDNRPPMTIGRRGSGPLDLRNALAIWPLGSGGFAVADGVLGVKQVDAGKSAAVLRRTTHPGTDITGACQTPTGFAVYKTPVPGGRLVQVFDSLGNAGVSFGEPYQAESALVLAILSEGVVGCHPSGGFVYALSGQPFLFGHDPTGKRKWTLRIQDFAVGVQEEKVDSKGRRSIGLSADVKEFSLITNIVGYGADHALVQVVYHNQRSLLGRKDFHRLDTYLVDGKNGHAIFVGSDLPRVSQITGEHVVFVANDPFPQVTVRAFVQ